MVIDQIVVHIMEIHTDEERIPKECNNVLYQIGYISRVYKAHGIIPYRPYSQ